jgi:hypothetical protein
MKIHQDCVRVDFSRPVAPCNLPLGRGPPRRRPQSTESGKGFLGAVGIPSVLQAL